jgi:hypothetical protein
MAGAYLVQDVLQVAAPVLDVPEDPPGQPGVGVRVDEQLHVEHVPQARVVEDEDSLD